MEMKNAFIKYKKPQVSQAHLEYSNLGESLRILVSENGIQALGEVRKVEDFLRGRGVNNLQILQLSLLLEESNLSRYLSKNPGSVSLVDINNIITCAERTTGLRRDAIRDILAAILYSMDLSNALVHTPVQATGDQIAYQDRGIVMREKYRDIESQIIQAVNAKDTKKLLELLPDLNRLAEAGVPQALYWKGVCYDMGLGAEKNLDKVHEYMEAAARGGCPEANAYLGDYYFSKDIPDFDTALRYYTEIGAVALNRTRQKNVRVILAAEPKNFKMLCMTGILTAILIVFNVMMAQGMLFKPDVGSNVVWAWISSILVLVTYALSCRTFFILKLKHIDYKVIPAISMLLFSLCTFFAMI